MVLLMIIIRCNVIFIHQYGVIDPKTKVFYICLFVKLDKNVKTWDKMQNGYSDLSYT